MEIPPWRMIIIKIYDCFTYFNEFELLELRLNVLKDVVDYFVLVEANKTHKNDNKDFNFEKNKEMFKEYLDKIIYIKVEDMPSFDSNNEWELENYQRNCIIRGLENTHPEDIIFISDIDEIPDPNVIKVLHQNISSANFCINFLTRDKLRKNIKQILKFPDILFKSPGGMSLLDKTPLALEQTLLYYFVNCKSKGKWNGSVITKAKNLSTPQKLRDKRNQYPRIRNGGWHFSYLGGVERILIKLNSIVESTANSYSADYIKNCISGGLDIYGRKGKEFEYEFFSIDHTLPEYVKTLIEKYPRLYFSETIQ
jgi:beta-1,4-mannosyl-glycoprotein beta-1,4-N-acetylglucosaminyltransferase